MWVWCDTKRDLSGVEGMGEWVDGMDEAKGDGQCCQVRFTGKYAGPLPLDQLALASLLARPRHSPMRSRQPGHVHKNKPVTCIYNNPSLSSVKSSSPS